VQRAVEIGDERAAAEVGVSRATLRSWRRRLKAEGGPAPASAGSGAGVAVSAPAASGVVADGDELARLERELAEVREARAGALERSVRLATAGNDLSAQHAARAARDFATAARALAAEVALLRESAVRISRAEAELLLATIDEWGRDDLGIPWGASSAARRLLGLRLRRLGQEAQDGDADELARLAADARSELRRVFGVTPAPSVPVPRGEDPGDALDADDEVPADEAEHERRTNS
jgi:transposase-like protein